MKNDTVAIEDESLDGVDELISILQRLSRSSHTQILHSSSSIAVGGSTCTRLCGGEEGVALDRTMGGK